MDDLMSSARSSETVTTSSSSLGWCRALPFDSNDAGYHIFEAPYQGVLYRLQVLVEKEGRLWKTDWALISCMSRPFLLVAEKTVKERLRPKIDVDCSRAKQWADSILLSPMAQLAKGLATS